MFFWIKDNLSTLIISLILFAVVAAVTIKLIRDKKHGKSSCGCGNCPMGNICSQKGKSKK